MAYILIAEDEQSINDLLAVNLKLVGHTYAQVFNGEDAVKAMEGRMPDLVLLDIMLPGIDGFAVMEQIPEDIPVIFVTAKAELEDHLKERRSGVDDYIIKPFDILEVLTRVENVLRRTKRGTTDFTIRDIQVDLSSRRVYRGGEEVVLTPQEFSLLETLILNRNLALSRDQLIRLAWGYDYEGETRTVDVHIQRLRKKLGLSKEIQTVFKVGYRLNTRL